MPACGDPFVVSVITPGEAVQAPLLPSSKSGLAKFAPGAGTAAQVTAGVTLTAFQAATVRLQSVESAPYRSRAARTMPSAASG